MTTIFYAHQMLSIWNPAIWHFHPNEKKRNRMQLLYRTRGIVFHDRVLNDGNLPL